MTIRENFAHNLGTAIEARDLRKIKVAHAAKVSRAHLDIILKNTCDPGLDTAEKLAKAVGFPFAALTVDPEEFQKAVLTTV